MNYRRWSAALLAACVFASVAMAVNVRDFIPEGATDTAAGIQAAHDSLIDPDPRWPDESGGELYFPPGTYIVRSPIKITIGNLQIRGTGGPWPDGKSTWIRRLGDGPLFVFPHGNKRINGFKISGLVLYGAGGVAFEIHDGSVFRRDFTLERLGAMRFSKVIETKTQAGGIRRIGNIKIRDCVWTQNGQAIEANDCWLSMLSVADSEIRQNRPPADRFVFELRRATSVTFRRNCLEGQRNTLLFDGCEGVTVEDNYFEGNPGLVLSAKNTKQISVGNYYRVLRVDEGGVRRFLLEDCRDVRWSGRREWYGFDDCTNVTPNPTVR